MQQQHFFIEKKSWKNVRKSSSIAGTEICMLYNILKFRCEGCNSVKLGKCVRKIPGVHNSQANVQLPDTMIALKPDKYIMNDYFGQKLAHLTFVVSQLVYNKLNITILEEEESGDTKSYFFNFESKLERLTWLEM